MKTILRIARVELSFLFYSPIAWLVLIVFTFQSGFHFVNTMQGLEEAYYMGERGNNLTAGVWSGPFGFFAYVQEILILYVPLLTMGLFSREISSGSIKLLLSSPTRSSEIIAGKFLAIMVYGLILVTILACLIVASHLSIRDQDDPLLLSGLLGLYLLICAYSAVGLFMSSLTAYQVVAAVSTMVIFAVLSAMTRVGQDIAFVRDITYFLSISYRSDQMATGLIASKDLFYFLIVIVLFLGLMFIKLELSRDTRHWGLKAARYLLFVSVALIIGYITSRPTLTFYFDMTATKARTLTAGSQQVVKNIKGPLNVHIYANILDQNYYGGMPDAVNGNIGLFEQYYRFIPDIDFDYTVYYDTSKNEQLYKDNPGLSLKDLALKVADSREYTGPIISPPDMKQKADLKQEEYRFIRQLELGGKKTNLRMFHDQVGNPMESEISAGLKRLTDHIQTIAFVSGHGERDMERWGDDQGYKKLAKELTFRFSLLNYGFDIITVALPVQEIPDTVSILVIADPLVAFATADIEKIKRFIDKGGNLVIAGEPGNQDLLNPITSLLGVNFVKGSLAEQSREFGPTFIRGIMTPAAGVYAAKYKEAAKQGLKVEMPGAMGLSYHDSCGYKVDSIVVTNANTAWNRPNATIADTGKLVFQPQRGDVKAVFPVALALSRKAGSKEQRIMIFGDADFMNNAALAKNNPMVGLRAANFDLSRETFFWLSNNEYPVDATRPVPKDDWMLLDRKEVGSMSLVFVWLMPGLLLTAGVFVLLRRMRK